MTITYEKFVETYKPIKNHIIQDAPYNGCMFETYGSDLEIIRLLPFENVWTLIDCEGKLYLSPGKHIVNRLNYFVCKNKWTFNQKDYKY